MDITLNDATLVFEDDGQDFLEWDVKNGEVIDCRPFQADMWNGTKVYDAKLDERPVISTKYTKGLQELNHTIADIRPLV